MQRELHLSKPRSHCGKQAVASASRVAKLAFRNSKTSAFGGDSRACASHHSHCAVFSAFDDDELHIAECQNEAVCEIESSLRVRSVALRALRKLAQLRKSVTQVDCFVLREKDCVCRRKEVVQKREIGVGEMRHGRLRVEPELNAIVASNCECVRKVGKGEVVKCVSVDYENSSFADCPRNLRLKTVCHSVRRQRICAKLLGKIRVERSGWLLVARNKSVTSLWVNEDHATQSIAFICCYERIDVDLFRLESPNQIVSELVHTDAVNGCCR
mmetsp:Transcript_14816/g.39688  ORF Transcript_14816/g.39688 Transcript_14816/m.39688 type:complete len:271 (+) Transcript_14816:2653-3465(+)